MAAGRATSSDLVRDDAGVTTVEGMVAGSRAGRLAAARAADAAAFDRRKEEIAKAKAIKPGHVAAMDTKFAAATDFESSFKASELGLVTADEFRRARQEAKQQAEEQARAAARRKTKAAGETRKRKRRRKNPQLSFDIDEEAPDAALAVAQAAPAADVDDSAAAQQAGAGGGARVEADGQPGAEGGAGGAAGGEVAPVRRIGKDPTVRTDFLPDAERDAREAEQRAALKRQWEEEQVKIKKEKLEITYSYWDGSGHRRSITVPKGTTIAKFLEWVRQDLVGEFPELRTLSADALMYVKEDLIIPQQFSFYDLIVTKARGKSGPLFHFDVHDDVRVGALDARIEKDESHPGKIVERRWYERNKHIFPASRWEVYDPAVKRDKYTIHGGEVISK